MTRFVIVSISIAVLLCGCAGAGEPVEADCPLEQIAELTDRVQQLEQAIELMISGRRSRLDFTGGQRGRVETIYLWDWNAGDETLRPVEVLVADHLDPVTAVARAWVAGAPDVGLFSGVGSYPAVLGSRVEAGVAIIDFDPVLAEFPGGSAWVSSLSTGLVYTVTELDGVDAILVTINGEPAMLHGMVWTEPTGRDRVSKRLRLGEIIRYAGPAGE